jgi:hypothetical protein
VTRPAGVFVLLLLAACSSSGSDGPSTSTPTTSAEHNTPGCAQVRSSADALAVSSAGASPAVQVENARQARQLLVDRSGCFDDAYRARIEGRIRDLTG